MKRPFAQVTFLLVAGCGRFQASPDSDGGTSGTAGSCVEETCKPSEPACRSYDFQAGCPPEWGFGGDPPGPLVIKRCENGKLHLFADGTLDADAHTTIEAPKTPWAVRISAKVTVHTWDSDQVLTIRLGDNVIAEVDAVMAPSGNVRFSFCDRDATGCKQSTDAPRDVPPDTEVLFAFDLSPKSGLAVTTDCQTFATRPAPALPPNGSLVFVFGKINGDPLDGTIDDVEIRFRDPP